MPTDGNFYATNGTRAYPLDDAASHADDSGARMPFDLLVDCSIRFPAALGQTLVLSSLTSTRTLVTATFAASADVLTRTRLDSAPAGLGFGPVAVVAVPQPVAPYRAYPVTAVAAGAAGFATFGPGVARDYAGRFSTPAQGAILPRCASPVGPPPVPGIARAGAAAALSGAVSLLPGQDLRTRVATVGIGGQDREAILIGLAPSAARDVFATYAGPCAGRPESGTCDPPGIDMINTASPTDTGDINIEFSGALLVPLAHSAGGLLVSVPTAVEDLCPAAGAFADPATGELAAEPASPCADSTDFGPVSPAGFAVVMGLFSAGPDGYTAEFGGVPAISVRDRIPAPARISASMVIRRDPTAAGVDGGIAFGFGATGAFQTYTLVLADVADGYLGIYSGLGYGRTRVAGTPLDAAAAAAIVGVPVQLTVILSDAGADGVAVAAELIGAGVRLRVDGLVPSAEGRLGLASYRGVTTFTNLTLEDWANAG